MANKSRILIVTNSISGGGAEISMSRLFYALKLRGYEVELCALNSSRDESVTSEGMILMGRQWGAGIFQTLQNMLLFRKFIKAWKGEIVIANCELPELYLALFCPRTQKIIAVEHTSRPWLGRKLLGLLVRILLNLRGTVWVTVSRDQRRIWPFHNSVQYIPNAFLDGKKQKNGKIESTELVFVGRLNKGKHPEVAAEAAQLANSSITFYGDGPMLSDLRKKYESETCLFRGFVSNPWDYISNESILIVASDFEGDGMSIVEGVLNGNPILLKDNADLRRFNFSDSMYFQNTSELISKITIARDKNFSLYSAGANIVQEIRSERAMDSVINSWVSLFGRLRIQ